MTPDPEAETGPAYAGVCFRCGECCTRYQVLVERDEIDGMSGYLGIKPSDFLRDYTDTRWPVPGKSLLRHRDNGGCIFLVLRGREALCSVQSVKPKPCRDWAPALSRKECRQGLARVWGLALNEKDELCGTEHDKAVFLEYLESLEENTK
jgi:Fe-S-cluster containining protein